MNVRELSDKYLGVPYLHLGRSLQGLDCYGLIIMVYKEIGYNLIDLDNYDKNWTRKGEDLFVDNYQKQWVRVITPHLYDVILFTGAKGLTNHAGIYLRPDRFLHCVKAGVVIGKFSNDLWANRIAGYFRLRLIFNIGRII